MAKKGGGAVYRVTEVIGTSSTSWEDAVRNAVKTAAGTFRARLALSFKYGG
jgi:flavin-binding protein dodecin